METSEALTEAASERRRMDTERRVVSWRTVVFGFARSRRRSLRRGQDADAVFMDWHHPWLFFLSVGIMLLSCADAFLTLQLLERGMIEANPVMAAVLGQGTMAFSISKVAMTGTSILALVFLAKFHFLNRFRTGLFLTGFFSFYCCLVCYEIVELLATL